MAYRRRKEMVEAQIREHNLAKSEQKNGKCPMVVQAAKESTGNATNEDGSVVKSENNSEAKCPENKIVDKNNKKVVVSIQTNEEKSKENILSMGKHLFFSYLLVI